MPSTHPEIKGSLPKKVAAVILAAGQSIRFGKPKQLLEFKGKTFIKSVIDLALAAKLSPVLVVLGANYEIIVETLQGYGNTISIVINQDWSNGQSSSVRIAVESIDEQCDGALFILADQPQIPLDLINRIVEAFSSQNTQIIAPYVGLKRGNPVLFSKSCFTSLSKGKGNQGGRFLFAQIEPYQVAWDDPRILIDVDTEEDYEILEKSYEN